MIQWVELIYSRFLARIQNNGHFTNKFEIQKGVHQGGPASSLLFLICAELLALELRNSENVLGIPVNDVINLLGQFADDMDIYLLYEKKSLHTVLEILDKFKLNTGFTVNYEKTQMYRIGSLRKTNAKLFTQKEVKWTSDPINVLGVTIDHDIQKCLQLNYEPIIQKVKSVLHNWKKRKLSLLGKIYVINSLIASLFIYKMMVLPKIPDIYVKKVEDIIVQYIWNGHKPKIALKALQASKKSGGAKLVDLSKRDTALKATWISILEKDKQLSNLVYSVMKIEIGDQLWKCNLEPRDIDNVLDKLQDPFWKDVAKAWHGAQGVCKEEIFIWYNSLKRIEDRPIFWKIPYQKGLSYIHQLFSGSRLKSIPQLEKEFGLTLMQSNSLCSAIPSFIKRKYASEPYVVVHQIAVTPRVLYEELVLDQSLLFNKWERWQQELDTDIDYTLFLQGFQDIYSVTNVAKYRSFQFRLLHRAIITNVHLFRWGLAESNVCTFCKCEKETYVHLFVYCQCVRDLWVNVEQTMSIVGGLEPIHFDTDTVMWNRVIRNNAEHVKNLICLVTKQYIYRKRCQSSTPEFHELKQIIFNIRAIERYIATKNNKLSKHNKKWKTVI